MCQRHRSSVRLPHRLRRQFNPQRNQEQHHRSNLLLKNTFNHHLHHGKNDAINVRAEKIAVRLNNRGLNRDKVSSAVHSQQPNSSRATNGLIVRSKISRKGSKTARRIIANLKNRPVITATMKMATKAAKSSASAAMT